MAMLTGLIIAWAIAVPLLTSMQPPVPDLRHSTAHTIGIWRSQVRFIGAGAIAVAAIYTRQTRKAGCRRIVSTLASSRATSEREDDRDRDLSGT